MPAGAWARVGRAPGVRDHPRAAEKYRENVSGREEILYLSARNAQVGGCIEKKVGEQVCRALSYIQSVSGGKVCTYFKRW